LGIHANLLGRWKREHEDGGKRGSDKGNTVAMKTELNRLRKENKRLKMEREILKKAATPSSRKNRAEVSVYRYPEEGLQGCPIV